MAMIASVAPAHANEATTTERLCYGGVEVELVSGDPRVGPLHPEERAACARPGDFPVSARVRCEVRAGLSPSEPAAMRPYSFAVQRSEAGWQLDGALTRATVRECANGDYVAAATIRDGSGVGRALHSVVTVVAEASGAIPLHAAARFWEGGVVLFVGPSGAGKSTASDHLPTGVPFAKDEVTVIRSAGGFQVWRSPAGSPGRDVVSGPPVAPLRAVLAVQQARDAVRVRALDAPQQLFVLRRAVEVGDCSPEAESRRLDALFELASTVPVGQVSTVLGAPLESPLRAWLSYARRGASG